VLGDTKLNSYAVPAATTLGLLSIETLYLALCLPETKGWRKDVEEPTAEEKKDKSSRTMKERKERLKNLEWIHFGFLFFFSGELHALYFLLA